jgi:hypothetical protein
MKPKKQGKLDNIAKIEAPVMEASAGHGEAAVMACTDMALVSANGFNTAELKEMSLDDLAAGINERLPEIEVLVSGARAQAEQALKVAIETGHYLNAAKQRTEKGQWLVWLAKYCSGLSRATAYRYQALAKNSSAGNLSHVRNGQSAMTIRQAYRATGILPDEPAKKKAPDLEAVPPAFKVTDLVAQIKAFTEFLKSVPLEKVERPFEDQLHRELDVLGAACRDVQTELLERWKTLKSAKPPIKAGKGVTP